MIKREQAQLTQSSRESVFCSQGGSFPTSSVKASMATCTDCQFLARIDERSTHGQDV